ncbi:hypothetical protein COW36_09130 [bacterium (Candidatus Blackallbacteria) CG17_big_fil_post_rev_8_21_14_2_50_48_46]|uniref:Uncharacterized protein n=1 Tax=bacterium (Candidatus Blackallbacteria) CG17_big_fil_post_rev_8_21_14_2_50_48_46 TaxID=2014261 RepID=A0A2M7G5T6_9BACT|nr:MAG: hypothetical protein COW64_23920 [bacterium (Candidatus Blackallbacteria) CG18_big_fil_WC_8_21_14_2_50_49_26]PIW17328.1 MAG: hypothetical protein COW36_09130 [bacterium (Candidatus Blackallbacteria) CG17_big_fil_post_rev_8_21_14_2_50_48_46]PIW47440.1 MAG: hypothetical protein COW20_12700 [bacterium (Candidatus Blackallbacteria) CG13_big_fil_rev_8_21_14_2_50_49_14]
MKIVDAELNKELLPVAQQRYNTLSDKETEAKSAAKQAYKSEGNSRQIDGKQVSEIMKIQKEKKKIKQAFDLQD